VVSVDASQRQFVTHVGGYATTDDVNHHPVPAEQTDRTPGQYVTLIIRHDAGKSEMDDVYQVAAGANTIVDIDGQVRFAPVNRRVFVNAGDDTVRTIRMDSTGRGPSPSVPHGHPLPGHTPFGTVAVTGDATNGVSFTAGPAGRYQFTYESGAYSTYPSDADRKETWLTTVLIFEAGKNLFQARRIRKEDALARLADTKYWSSRQDAEDAATGQHVELDLRAGQQLRLAAVDRKGYYASNPGAVVVICEYLGAGTVG
jgi:hypothetical protein